MSTITYDRAPAESRVPAKRKGLFARLIEARQQQAINELRRHSALLPHELEQAAWKITERSEDSLPFLR
jgi:hypothetical protein